MVPVWKGERRLNPFPHCGTPALWFSLGQSVGMGPPRNPVLPAEKNNSEYGFQWQTPLWLQLLFHQDADLLRPKCFARRVLIQQASAKTQAVIRGNLDHRAGFYPNLVHIPASVLGILLSRCCSSKISTCEQGRGSPRMETCLTHLGAPSLAKSSSWLAIWQPVTAVCAAGLSHMAGVCELETLTQ